MKRIALLGLLALPSASAQIDPVLYEHAPNLTPYTRLCLAAEAIYPHEMKPADVQWIRATIQQAVKGSGLPVLAENHPECAPMRVKASDTHAMLFVEIAPSLKANVPWQLQLRVTDPHLLGANGNVYQPILWELRQTIGPARPHITRSVTAAFTWLNRVWKTAHSK